MVVKYEGNDKVAVAKERKIKGKNPIVNRIRVVNGKAKEDIDSSVYLKRAYRIQ